MPYADTGRTKGEKLRFINDINRAHDHIDMGNNLASPTAAHRPETAALRRSKSFNRHTNFTGQLCFPEMDGATGRAFENRVADIVKLKNSNAMVNSSVMEAWINETLKDAEHLEIPGIIIKPVHKMPMSRYGIDKLYLHSQGLPMEDIERIYRSLFVYSIGFYEMILKCVTHAKNKYSILSSLWKVFQILLEYCCKSNYQMMIAKISTEHSQQIEKLEDQFQSQINQLVDNEKNMKEMLTQYSVENHDLKIQLSEKSGVLLKL